MLIYLIQWGGRMDKMWATENGLERVRWKMFEKREHKEKMKAGERERDSIQLENPPRYRDNW